MDPNCIEFNLSFKKKNIYISCHIKSHFNLKSSLLTLDFSVWLSVEYTLNTLYLTQKLKKYSQKTDRPKLYYNKL